MHIAAEAGSKTAADVLLKYHPDVIDRTDSNDRTALIIASMHGHTEVVEFLLAKKAKITKDRAGKNCLNHAVSCCVPDVALAIIEANPPVWKEV